MKKLLIKNGTILTFDEENRVLENHGLAICDGIIERLAPLDQLEEEKFELVLDARGKVVMPGLINAHMHFYSSFATGLTKAEPAHNFAGVLNNLWWRLDKQLTLEDSYLSAKVSCLDAIRHGTTTIIDHHASPSAVRGSLNMLARAVKKTGLRASLCYEVSDRDGEEIAEEGLAANAAHALSQNHPRIHALFGLHAAFTLSEQTLNHAVDMAQTLGCGFHIHVAEDRLDQQRSQEQFGMSVVKRLEAAGVLGPQTIAAHCVHVDDAEIALLAETGTMVTHQPQSNMNNGVGVFPLEKMMKAGVLVGLGTDAMTQNMLEELRVAVWLQRLHHADPSVGFLEAVTALTRNNPKIVKRIWNIDLGVLRVGAAADVVIRHYDPSTPLHGENLAGHLVFGLPHARVDTTLVAGEILLRDGHFTQVDEAGIKREARQRAAALWSRF